MPSLVERSALQLAASIRRGDVSVEEVTRAFLERARLHDPAIGAFVTLAGDQALAVARQLDRERSRSRPSGVLWGVPVGIKDLNLVRGLPVRMGSASLRWLVAPFDDDVARRARRANLVVLGKLATSEYAILPFVDPAIHGPTRNPYGVEHYAGGSSGGSGAAVAARFLPFAFGSDEAGSLRIPAAFCGLVTLKPSRGALVSSHGRLDDARISADGPLARDVLDAAALADVLCADPRGPSLLEQAQIPPTAPLAVGVATRSAMVELEPEIRDAMRAFVARVAALGHRIERDDASFVDGGAEEFLPIMQRMVRNAPVVQPSKLEPLTRWMREQGALYDATSVRVLAETLTRRVDAWFGALDVWVTPTVAIPPPRVGAYAGPPPRELYHAVAPLGAYTAPFNVAGYPAMSLPIGRTTSGLPIGAQLVMRPGEDGRLLRHARGVGPRGPRGARRAPAHARRRQRPLVHGGPADRGDARGADRPRLGRPGLARVAARGSRRRRADGDG